MALKDYIFYQNQCILNNHFEFCKLLKWFLKHGAENYCGGDMPMFNSLYDILDELDVTFEDFNCESYNEEEYLLIHNILELEEFLLDNINDNTLIPSEDEYPLLVIWYKSESFDRFGDTSTKILNFTSMKEIKSVDDFMSEYEKKLLTRE